MVYIGSYSGGIFALNAETGALLWSKGVGYQLDSTFAVADGVVYVGAYNHNVYAFRAKTGAELWSYDTGYYVDNSSRCSKWGGLCRLRQRKSVRAGCQDRCPAVELPRWGQLVLARSSERAGLHRLVRRSRLRLRPPERSSYEISNPFGINEPFAKRFHPYGWAAGIKTPR